MADLDELSKFLAFMGEYGSRADYAEQVERLQVGSVVKKLLIARDQQGLEEHFRTASEPVKYVFIRGPEDTTR